MLKKILVIEDNLDTTSVMRTVLEREGYSVMTALDGEKGLESARTFHPDVILLDLMMPIMDGHTTNHHLKKDPLTKNIPVIVVSAHSEAERPATPGTAAPIDGYLIKPVSTKLLLAKIQAILGASPK